MHPASAMRCWRPAMWAVIGQPRPVASRGRRAKYAKVPRSPYRASQTICLMPYIRTLSGSRLASLPLLRRTFGYLKRSRQWPYATKDAVSGCRNFIIFP